MSSNPKGIIQAILTNDKLNEEEKSELIAEFIKGINEEYPELKYHATKSDVKETELKLTKEIENTRKEIKELDLKLTKEIKEIESGLTKEIKELDLKLTKEIESTRKEIKELDLKLTKEIKEVDAKLTKEIKELDLKLTKEIESTRKEIKEAKFVMLKWQFIFWVTQIGAIIAIFYKLVK